MSWLKKNEMPILQNTRYLTMTQLISFSQYIFLVIFFVLASVSVSFRKHGDCYLSSCCLIKICNCRHSAVFLSTAVAFSNKQFGNLKWQGIFEVAQIFSVAMATEKSRNFARICQILSNGWNLRLENYLWFRTWFKALRADSKHWNLSQKPVWTT